MDSIVKADREEKIPLVVDGSHGEGGGQIFRTALAVAAATGRPLEISKIRHNRSRPGLLRQHLTALNALARICDADVEGASLGSTKVSFRPKRLKGGDYEFAVGTAGSTMLVLQTLLMPLLLAEEPTRLVLRGGTHAKSAPPLEFTEQSLLPLLRGLGADVQIKLKTYGFYPAGGGEVEVMIRPLGEPLRYLDAKKRGALHSREIQVITAFLPRHVANRELLKATELLKWPIELGKIHRLRNASCPGNALLVALHFGNHSEVFTAYGEKGKSAEKVAHEVVEETETFLNSEAVIGPYLADQLLLPLALQRGGSFLTGPLTSHCSTQVDLLSTLLGISIEVNEVSTDLFEVTLEGPHSLSRSQDVPSSEGPATP